MMAIIRQHLGSATRPEIQVNGSAAIFVGVLLICGSMVFAVEWLKQFKDRL